MSIVPPYPPQARSYSQQAPPISTVQTLTDTASSSSDSLSTLSNPLIANREHAAGNDLATPVQMQSLDTKKKIATAVVYCEGNFGAIDGKTANGLVRYSEKYEILSVIDSEKAGLDTGMVLDNKPNAIPICNNLTDSLIKAGCVPDYFIFGMAPSSGMLSKDERSLMLKAMDLGMNIVNGLHEFLSDDPEFSALSAEKNVEILDIRKPRPHKELRMFSGRIAEVTCPRIAVLGTDCAIGKRTTATILTHALNDCGIKAVMIGTGQTGLIQGARYGVALDAVPSQFCAGELEATIVEAFEIENPDVIIIEGQGALGHPAFSTTSFILRGSCPDGVVLQHAPGRPHRCDFEQMAIPAPATEINLIQTFAETKVIGLTINHEKLTDAEVTAAIALYEHELGIPATDALTRPTEHLVEIVLSAFPELKERVTVPTQ
ncbi:MAG: DUF1611 domain-containing protein [Candidatus Thiodiazotropha sp. (ex Epidulcina cf. delphinae)]|nr:DUF1611 domain-containing protein [Candidatus Thiodiazotropha sp. (ex Epidulcina cf. delphinae)]